MRSATAKLQKIFQSYNRTLRIGMLKKPPRNGSLGGLGLVVHLGAFALLGFEFLLFLELALGFFDAEAGVHF